ncbi:Gfo/Idh/MocA family oxidoreductase [Schlesneria sp.]|uniref:Gfo/Idh/MocA family oxidoreductase n=1 Tax=Schlesneria sp. TaxID=2762018 RepID=UPI002F25D166
MSYRSDRRDFLKSSTAALAGATLPYWFTSTSNLALGRQTVNSRPVLGCVGTGDRWNAVGPNAMEFSDCVAVCDVDREHVEKARNRVRDIQSKKGISGDPEMYEDYRKLLDRKDIDVVTIVTTDHWHSKIAIEAMQAGKDVYCEKPLTLTILEGKQIIKVLNETKRVFQVGTQQRSEMSANDGKVQNQFLKAVAIARSGRLGKIKKVTCGINRAEVSSAIPVADIPPQLNWEMWLGQAPLTEYRQGGFGNNKHYPESRTHYEFRWWYEYSGGKMTDWGAHHVDIGMWALGMDNSGPISVEGTAEHPVPFENGMPTVSDRYNVATKFDVTARFENGAEMLITSEGDNGVLIEGTEGRIFVNRGKLTGAPVEELAKNPLPETLLRDLYKGKDPKGGRNAHMANFFDCVQDRGLPVSDVYSHHRAMTTCHLANIAIRLGRKIEWDPKTEQIINDKDAAKWITREQRKGYEINISV